jgi:hypothetical protein
MNHESFTLGITATLIVLMGLLAIHVHVGGDRFRALQKRVHAIEQAAAVTNLGLTIDPKRGRLISVEAPGAGPVEIENFTVININGEWRATWQAK